MKKFSNYFLMIVGLLALLPAVTGCNTVSVNANQYVGAPQFPPSNPADIQILREQPSRPSIQLGEVRAEPSNDGVSVQKIEEALRNAAAKLGADAVVITADRTEVVGAFVSGPWFGRQLQPIQGRVVVGIAIKYK